MDTWHDIEATYRYVTIPYVQVVDPANGRVNVPVNHEIIVTFSEDMDQTATKNAFSIFPSVSGTKWWYNTRQLIFTPTPSLADFTTYNVTIDMGAKDLDGDHIASDYTWLFTTGNVHGSHLPNVDVGVTPGQGAKKIGDPSPICTVTVSSLYNFESPVTLSVLGLPAGAECSFSQNPVTPPPNGTVTSNLTIALSEEVEAGAYTLRINGTSGELMSYAEFTLTAALPTPPLEPPPTIPPISTTQTSNLVLNPGFEEWEYRPEYGVDFPTHWDNGKKWEELAQQGDPTTISKSTNAHSGSYAVALGEPSSKITLSVIKQDIYGIIPGETYNFSFWTVGRNNYGSLAARALVWWMNASGYPVGYPSHTPALVILLPSGGVTSYTRYNGTTTTAPPEAIFAEIQFGRYSWGGITVDDVSLTGPYNIAVTDVKPSKTVAAQGYTLFINVTAKNKGNYNGAFKATAYANETSITSQRVTLESGASTTITFTWNTTGFAKGNYTIKAIADTVPGETDTTDNTQIDGIVFLTIAGDVDNSGLIDVVDIVLVVHALWTTPASGGKSGEWWAWNPNSDIDSNSIVDAYDLFIVTISYLEHA